MALALVSTRQRGDEREAVLTEVALRLQVEKPLTAERNVYSSGYPSKVSEIERKLRCNIGEGSRVARLVSPDP
ncbi:hypothetical protein CCP3SC5AM1_100015 [Gammaproteobacteria bacterium]